MNVGVGKSFGISKFVTNQFLKKGEQFAYIRRYKSELQKAVPTFFDILIDENVFPDNHLSVSRDKFYCDKKCMGYSMQLSTAQDLKSSNFNKVKTIIFDEFRY